MSASFLGNLRLRRALSAAVASVTACATLASFTPDAAACGCTSPPVPTVNETSFAVNQQSEQIIFEVEPGFVTAHVLIRYVGDPSQFAWLVPVPAVPELDLSESALFGLLDGASSPLVNAPNVNRCPSDVYTCEHHPPPDCYDPNQPPGGSTGPGGTGTGTGSGGGSQGAGGGGGGGFGPDGVDVKKTEQIGSYETVVFAAGDAQAAVDWLQTNGFIVNDTMTPFMQPYLDANMLFVAAKLIPGAGAEEIKPLQMRYAAAGPMIPLQLTAVAAEPNLTVTSYVFGTERYVPDGHPLVTLDPSDVSANAAGRVNYPMLLARAIDDAGRDGFIEEYSGEVPTATFQTERCCSSDSDQCFLADDAICQCPNQPFDATDCEEVPGITEAVVELVELQTKHPYMTRLTTRLSPEEMTFDPGFVGAGADGFLGRLQLSGQVTSLQACTEDIIDIDEYQDVQARQSCASIYCGSGECVDSSEGAACLCDAGHVARVFNDLDGLPSVTCVPATNVVDLSGGGEITLPDACTGLSCGDGTCVDVGGFPTCQCDGGHAATWDADSVVPICAPVTLSTGTRGARDYSHVLDSIAVCAPAPPTCGEFGWLVEQTNVPIEGVTCESSVPSPEELVVPPPPTCEDLGLLPPDFFDGEDEAGADPAGCGCFVAGAQGNSDELALVLLLGMAGLGLSRRRRR